MNCRQYCYVAGLLHGQLLAAEESGAKVEVSSKSAAGEGKVWQGLRWQVNHVQVE